ncbi:P-loop containing nucleoside triphosphate hydrolase protein [Rhodofomes roseus]|uniref:P-loop containing nucleoside triphosphate hydrolase protein n=1 Tax=Rhodofomes roseus TaxID=34475 RepID=A0ABQ8JZ29_9APHY|nr:P-loop containing nucleoside triphosphate hydrolase protein [Rhodofomes roseus]KAH9829555.1 P-loop containing nucleoside triphosphate hydrolase protein [Rhodofomes roseus]
MGYSAWIPMSPGAGMGPNTARRARQCRVHSDSAQSNPGSADPDPAATPSSVPALSTIGVMCSCGEFIRLPNNQYRERHLQGRRHLDGLQRMRHSQGPSQASEPGPAPAPTTDERGRRAHIPSTTVRCDICSILLDDMPAYEAHKQGDAHRRALTELAFASASATSSSTAAYIRCPVCERDLPAARWEAHVARDAYHRWREQYADVTAQVRSAEMNRNGVSVTGEAGGIDFGTLEADAVQGTSVEHTVEVTVSNDEPGSLITLQSARFTSSYRDRPGGSSFSALLRGASRFVNYGKPRMVVVTFHASYAGRFDDTLELEFHDVRRRERFLLLRRVLAVVGPAADYALLASIARGSYHRPLFVPHEPTPHAVPTRRPPTWSKVRWAVKLPEFPVPKALMRVLNTMDGRGSVEQIRGRLLPSVLNMGTYGKFFSTLLHSEEWQQSVNLSRSNLFDAPITAVGSRYKLPIPGLIEGKPTLRVGDTILVCKSDGSNTWHEAVIHQVNLVDVILRINPQFKLFPGRRAGKIDVKFQLNRMPWRRRQHAVLLDNNQARILFPTPEHTEDLRRPTAEDIDALSFDDATLIDNYEQKEVVAAIVNAPPGSVPFVVFGPPGTGKTVTLVEAALQILINNPNARLLLCAPTNEAADLIASKLMILGPSQLFRLNALWRPMKGGLQMMLKDFCLINGNKVYAIPEVEILKKVRAVVTTCVSAGVPNGLGIERGWFTHVFVDEAGQCMEPDIMVPLKLLADAETNIVLAGDIKQLGPVIHSSIGRELGLGYPYMERLLKIPVYDLNLYGGITITKLVKHFRSHPAIIGISNRLFYANELQPLGDKAITHSMLRSTCLDGLNPQFPVVFHAISGTDEQEAGSPSYFNKAEASLVARYCEELVADLKVPLSAKDIGVISPYSAQCSKIRALLGRRSTQLEGVKVGTTEEFQGQERRVIIISTVRSNPAHALRDVRHRLGFVGDPQRFNVAITRARALLIVVGDPNILALDPVWKEFLAYVKRNRGWRGVDVSFGDGSDSDEGISAQTAAQQDVQELIQRLRSLTMENADRWRVPEPDSSDSEPDDEAYDDRPADLEE